MGNTYMPKPENRYPNNVSGFEHIWELDMLMWPQFAYKLLKFHQIFTKSSMVLENNNECINRHYLAVYREKIYQNTPQIAQTSPNFQQKFYDAWE